MKHPILVAAMTLCLAAPIFAQPDAGDPVQLRNPHRRGGGPMGGGLGGGGSMSAMPDNRAETVPAPSASASAPAVSMFVDGPFLFILRGDSLFQFDKKTLKLLNSTELPRAVATPSAPATNGGDTKTYTAPPLRPGRYNFNIGPTF